MIVFTFLQVFKGLVADIAHTLASPFNGTARLIGNARNTAIDHVRPTMHRGMGVSSSGWHRLSGSLELRVLEFDGFNL